MREIAYKFISPKAISYPESNSKLPIKLKLPTSKSYSNRALVISALCDGKVHLKNVQYCDDIVCMIEGLRNLGVLIEEMGKDLIVHGRGGRFIPAEDNIEIDGHMAGTTSRFLMALTSLVSESITITGRGRLPERPFRPLLDSLKKLGKKVDFLTNRPNQSLPVSIKGPRVVGGGKVSLSGNETGQFITALLMVAPLFDDGLTIEVVGEISSRPYIDMTLEIMKDFGVDVKENGASFFIKGKQNYQRPTGVYLVEGDWTHAGYFLVMGLMRDPNTPPLILQGLSSQSVQGDRMFVDLLQKMGAPIRSQGLDLVVEGIGINGISERLKVSSVINLETMPDLAPTLIVLLSLIPGTHKIKGINNLKFKESDRLLALSLEFKKLNFYLRHYPDQNELVFEGKNFKEVRTLLSKRESPLIFETHQDHRMAMVFSLLGFVFDNIFIKSPYVVKKSYPDYWSDFQKCGGRFIEVEL